MGESTDARAAAGARNLWGTVPAVIEMRSESGAAVVMHGALQTGALATTFTSPATHGCALRRLQSFPTFPMRTSGKSHPAGLRLERLDQIRHGGVIRRNVVEAQDQLEGGDEIVVRVAEVGMDAATQLRRK